MLTVNVRCPICKSAVDADAKSRPFCSLRCKEIDLGRWLNEEYFISRPARFDEVIEEDDDSGPREPWLH